MQESYLSVAFQGCYMDIFQMLKLSAGTSAHDSGGKEGLGSSMMNGR